MKYISNCKFCSKEIVRRGVQGIFCSLSCKGNFQKENFKGQNNPNYNKKWSEEAKILGSERMKIVFEDPDIKYKCGNSNRGIKFSKERCENISKGHIGISIPHSKESKIKIGLKSKEKFTEKYKKNQRKIMEEKGYWLPLNEKTDFEIYYEKANWIEKMWDRFDDDRLKSIGIFSPMTNTKGLVRDHMLSRKTGFQLGIFPEILRHPANCQILTHSENIKKKKGKYIDGDHITPEILFTRIEKYDKQWIEQNIVLQKIEEFRMGNRYKREGGS